MAPSKNLRRSTPGAEGNGVEMVSEETELGFKGGEDWPEMNVQTKRSGRTIYLQQRIQITNHCHLRVNSGTPTSWFLHGFDTSSEGCLWHPRTQGKLLNLPCASACWTNCLGLNFTPSNFSRASKKKKKKTPLHLLDQLLGSFQTKSLDDLGVKACPQTVAQEVDAFCFLHSDLEDLFYCLQLACLCMLKWGARLMKTSRDWSANPLFPFGQFLCIFPPGGGVPVPPLHIHWYYIMAAGGALLLLAAAILVRALCCCRQHLATKKSQLSVAYHSSSQCFQYSNWSTSMATPGVEPVLTVRLDSRDRHRTLC